ncbi:MAG TPA: hypothetical protein VMF62_10260, partial [Acetobacteraceae bacterium]|nr:hypothetical protein [Acetobacteraceae bacterium]
MLTPSVDLVATILTGLSWNFWSFALFRLATGAGIGGALGVMISVLRPYLPENPRWLMTHGKEAKAAESVGEIEERMARHAGTLPPLAHAPIRLVAHDGGWFAAT